MLASGRFLGDKGMSKWSLSALVVSMLVFSTNSFADKDEWRQWPLGQRLIVGVGVYKPALDTEVNLTAGEIRGRINFEQNFGLDDSKSVPIAT